MNNIYHVSGTVLSTAPLSLFSCSLSARTRGSLICGLQVFGDDVMVSKQNGHIVFKRELTQPKLKIRKTRVGNRGINCLFLIGKYLKSCKGSTIALLTQPKNLNYSKLSSKQWSKNNESLNTSDERFEISKDGSLIMENVHPKDSGKYIMKEDGIVLVQYDVFVPGE